MNLVLLEDDPTQAELVMHWLNKAGLQCVHYATGRAFRSGILHTSADLILIDWMLPDDDGLEILVWLRKTLGLATPIMFVTARADEESLVLALDKGADDYLVKPLRRAETLARAKALLRRGDARKAAVVRLGGVQIDLGRHHATINGTPVELTERELNLAVYMLRNHGRLLTRRELQENVWHTNAELVTRTVDTHVSRVRNKLRLTPENGFDLSAIFHKGYRLEFHAHPGHRPGNA
jgi:DNA-binding response OmpR family regulator